MKVIRVLVLIMITAAGCSGTQLGKVAFSEDVYHKYRKAYNAVVSSDEIRSEAREVFEDNSLGEISVAAQVVYLDYWSFYHQIAELENNTVNSGVVADSLLHIDETRTFEELFDKDLQHIASSHEESLVLFFSAPYKNTLLAEILNLENRKWSYGEATTLSKGIRLLFFFDEANDVKHMLYYVQQYDL